MRRKALTGGFYIYLLYLVIQRTKKPLVLVSDDTSHTKEAVWTFMKNMFDYLREVKDSVKRLKIFSDNCAAQFKHNVTSLGNENVC